MSCRLCPATPPGCSSATFTGSRGLSAPTVSTRRPPTSAKALTRNLQSAAGAGRPATALRPDVDELALRTAAELAAFMPPPVHVDAPHSDISARQLERLEQLLGPDERVAFGRPRRGDWEARTYDPTLPVHACSRTGRGNTLAAAIADLISKMIS